MRDAVSAPPRADSRRGGNAVAALFARGDVPLPYVQKHSVRARLFRKHDAGEVRLRQECRGRIVVLAEDAVHVEATRRDQQILAGRIDFDLKILERSRGMKWRTARANYVGRGPALNMVVDVGLFVQVGIEHATPLLHADLAVVIGATEIWTC